MDKKTNAADAANDQARLTKHEKLGVSRITVLTSNRGPLVKRFKLVDGQIEKISCANFFDGIAETRDVATPAVLIELLEGLTSRQALAAGTLKTGTRATIKTAATAGEGDAARTLTHFHYPKGPGWLVWDYDSKSMPADVAERVAALGGPLAALFRIWPEAETAPYVIRPSSSGGVSAPGCAELESNGLHGFFLIEDVSRSKGALAALQARAWAAGLAWVALSKSGALLVRSIVDVTVGSPERLIFEAPPILDAPVTRRAKPAIVSDAVAPVAVPVNDPETAARAEQAEAEARRKIQPEARRVETAFVEKLAKTAAANTGRPVAEARKIIRQMLTGAILDDNHLLELRDGSMIRVGDLLDAPDRYDRMALPDPIEGLSYGPDKATLLLRPAPNRPDVGPRLVSHAHGATTVYKFQRYERASGVTAGASSGPDEAVPELPSATEARAVVVAAGEAFFAAVNAHNSRSSIETIIFPEGPLHALAAELGIGKTTSTLKLMVKRLRAEIEKYRVAADEYERDLAQFKRLKIEGDTEPVPPKRPSVVILVQMHRLSEQILDALRLIAPDLEAVIIRGVDADDPDAPGEKVCKQIDAYNDASSLLFDPIETVCKKCPFAAGCKVMAGRAAIADVYIAAHGALVNRPAAWAKRRWQRLDHVIIDEDPSSALIFDDTTRRLGFAAWMRTRSPGHELDAARQKLSRAAEINGKGPLRREALQEAGLEIEDADAASDAEWARKVTDRDDPDIEDNRSVRRAAGIWREAAAFLRKGHEASGRLTVVEDPERGLSLQHMGVRPVHDGWRNAPMLMLDGTAEVQIVEALMGRRPDKLTRAYADVPMLVLQQDASKSGAKSQVMEIDWASESANRAARNRQRYLAKYIQRRAKRAQRMLLISYKDLIAILEPKLPANVVTAHFGGLRGLNDFENVDLILIVGRWMPDQLSIEARAAALFDVPITGHIELKARVRRLVRGPTGLCLVWGECVAHSHPLANLVLRAIRDAELEQAIGRARAINRSSPVVVELLSDAQVRLPVHQVDLWTQITKWPSGGAIADMLDVAGVALVSSPTHAAQAFPQFWKTKQAARRAGLTGQQTSYTHLYEVCCPVEYSVPRRKEVFLAFVDKTAHFDPVAAVQALLPNALNVRVARGTALASAYRLGIIDLNEAATAADHPHDDDAENNVIQFTGGLLDLNTAPTGARQEGEAEEEPDIAAPAPASCGQGTLAHAREGAHPATGRDGSHARSREGGSPSAAPEWPVSDSLRYAGSRPIALPPQRGWHPPARGPIREDDNIICAPVMSVRGDNIVIFRVERPDERQRREICETVSPLMAAIKERGAYRAAAAR